MPSPATSEASEEGGSEEQDDTEQPMVEVVRAEFVNSRPVVISEVPVYISLRERNGRLFEDQGTCPHVRYIWSRGPLVKSCIFHPSTPSQFRDITKTFQFYCSRECFLRGWHSLPKEYWNPEPEQSEEGRKEENEGWVEVANTRTYYPTKNDIDRPLRLDIIPLMPDGSDSEVGSMYICTGTVMPTPEQSRTRRMISSAGAHLSAELLSKQFKVMDWNVLADLYTTKAQYPYCEKWALAWSWRKHLIIEELKSMAADVITLQEVQKDAFEDWFRPELASLGYEGVFQQKKREPAFHKGKYTVEGCATFYKTTRFRKLEKYTLDYDKLSVSHLSTGSADDSGSLSAEAGMCLQRSSRGNIALVLVLEDLTLKPMHRWQPAGTNGGYKLCIANTHICAEPTSTDVKTWQAHLLATSLEQRGHGTGGTPLIICGDFNSTPGSAVYEYLRHGSLRRDHADFKQDPCRLQERMKTGHTLTLHTAYEACSGREAIHTNFTEEFKGTLDYIFFSPDSLAALAVSQVDDEESLAKDVALPSVTRPSDHVSLVATFVYRDDCHPSAGQAFRNAYDVVPGAGSPGVGGPQVFVPSPHMFDHFAGAHWF